MGAFWGLVFLALLAAAFTWACLYDVPPANETKKPTPPANPAPSQIIESEGPFDNAVELLNVIGSHKEFDDWGIYVDEKLLRTAIPTDSDKYLVYETIGRKIYRK